MKRSAPDHIRKNCYIGNDPLYYHLCERYEDGKSFVYKLRCSCGCEMFTVYKDAHPTVYAQCQECKKMITVYDLQYYPSAVKVNGDRDVDKVVENPVLVYMNYEYSDEFMVEDEVMFDENDITWAKVFIADNGKLRMILDDETA